ncbi:hypothetical protein EC991_000259 [Linnemannia zychae]|nr:hypothetical protein EC991_000259 [Linnemannia zychae]
MTGYIFLDNGLSDVTSKLTRVSTGVVRADFKVGSKSFRLYDAKPDDVKYYLEKVVYNGALAERYRVYRDSSVWHIETYPVYF